MTLKFDRWPWKTIGHHSLATSSFGHHFIMICEFKLELWSGNCYIGFWPLWPWPFAQTLFLSSVITPENFMMIQWWEHCQKDVTDGQTDRQTDWNIHRVAWSQLQTCKGHSSDVKTWESYIVLCQEVGHGQHMSYPLILWIKGINQIWVMIFHDFFCHLDKRKCLRQKSFLISPWDGLPPLNITDELLKNARHAPKLYLK